MIFLSLVILPLLIAIAFWAFGQGKVTKEEFLFHMAVQLLVAGVAMGIIYYHDTTDYELWNGRVASKTRDEVSCEHSYSCNCYESCTGSGTSETCTTFCQTCYEHSYDVSWYLHTNNSESIYIYRVDRQGLDEPPRWTRAYVGEPTAVVHSFTNYIKASPGSLFRRQGMVEKFAPKIPNYPIAVYDYHYVNRLVAVGVDVPDAAQWNRDLMEINADLGAAKQVNAVVVVTKGLPQEYSYALEQAWIGAKKNDVVLVVGTGENLSIEWAYVMAWSQNEMIRVALRDQILDTKQLNRTKTIQILNESIKKHYVRKHMRDFEYLKASITPTVTQWIVSVVVGTLISLGLGIYLFKNDVSESDGGRYGVARNRKRGTYGYRY